jgi:hypothetical protein
MVNQCGPEVLSRGDMAKVEHCPCCNVISVHIGAFTFRVDGAAFEDICETLLRARAALRVRSGTVRALRINPAPRGEA